MPRAKRDKAPSGAELLDAMGALSDPGGPLFTTGYLSLEDVNRSVATLIDGTIAGDISPAKTLAVAPLFRLLSENLRARAQAEPSTPTGPQLPPPPHQVNLYVGMNPRETPKLPEPVRVLSGSAEPAPARPLPVNPFGEK